MIPNNGKYKILVDNLYDFQEASYILNTLKPKHYILFMREYENEVFSNFDGELINLSQLKDIAVLQRNDVRDVNYKTPTDDYYLSSDGELYVWNKGKWENTFVKLDLNNESSVQEQLEDKLKECQEESGLISGAEALRALADGEDIQVHESTYKNNIWFDLLKTRFTPSEILEGKVRDKRYKLKFRLKPRTVKLEIEVPAPFEPKVGDTYFYMSADSTKGYMHKVYMLDDWDKVYVQYGAWRTEDQIKIVVDQYRKIGKLPE